MKFKRLEKTHHTSRFSKEVRPPITMSETPSFSKTDKPLLVMRREVSAMLEN